MTEWDLPTQEYEVDKESELFLFQNQLIEVPIYKTLLLSSITLVMSLKYFLYSPFFLSFIENIELTKGKFSAF